MTIRIYPSKLPGEPLEIHQHERCTIGGWLSKNVDGFDEADRHPIYVEVEGKSIPPARWLSTDIGPEANVSIYPIPTAAAAPAWVVWSAVVLAVASAAYSIYMMSQMDTPSLSSTNGEALGLNSAKANTAKLGSPIREQFGRGLIYPDYVVQPVSRFVGKTNYVTTMLVSLGVGRFSFTTGDIKVGGTPVTALGSDFSYTVYPPGTDVSGDPRSENWFQSSEVGNTTSGGSGLDLGSTSPEEDSITANSVTVSGASLTFTGVRDGDNPTNDLPDSWQVGTVLTITIPDTMWVNTVGLYSALVGNSLTELGAVVGMPITLTYNGSTYDLYVASYTVDGVEPPTLTLAYDSATGAAFNGLPAGSIRLSIGASGNQYKITDIDALTITVERLINGSVDGSWPGFYNRTVLDFDVTGINDDEKWLGPFLACPENEITDVFEVDFSFPNGIVGFEGNGNKRTRHVEWEVQWRVYGSGSGWSSRYDVYAEKNPNGLGFTERFVLSTPGLVEVRCRRRNDQGSNNARDTMYWKALRSRLSVRPTSYPDVTTIGITFVCGSKVSAQSDRRINVVATRNYDVGTNRTISGAYYHLARSLGFNDAQIDKATIDALEASYWTPRGEYFDYGAASDSTSALDIFKLITQAGMGYFLLSDGLCSAGREGVKSWTGVISPQESTVHLQTSFKAPSQDDYDAVDVTYINGVTWAEETVQCRVGSDTPTKVEDFQLDGVLDKDRAYRIGMRRLMKYRLQRLTHSTTTEMDALCYNFMDRIVLTDDIPGSDTISCLIVDMKHDDTKVTLKVSEPLDWSFNNPRVVIRYQDGSASPLLVPTRIDDFTLTVENSPLVHPDDWIIDDPAVESPRLIFCSSERAGYDGLLSDISPENDGTCGVTALQYRPEFYQHDDDIYPGNL